MTGRAVTAERLEPVLTVSGAEKSFGAARALSNATIALRRGEVHGLLGANGAGKSTLSRVMSGHIRPDKGSITLDGQALSLRNPRAGLDAGIVLVTQETTLAADLSVMENIFLADMGTPGRLSFSTLRKNGLRILNFLGQGDSLRLDDKVNSLSIAQKQLVEIAKALAVKAKIIIFDEPTSSLSPSEVDRLFSLFDRLRSEGCAIVFVSHRLEEVFRITDCVTVMREGRSVAESVATASLSQADLIRLMVGQELGSVYANRVAATHDKGLCRLSVRNLAVDPIVKDISFDLHRGEILGLGGLVGAGRSETLEAIFGLRKRRAGSMQLDGSPFAPRTPAQAIRAGVALVPEDRRHQAIAPDMTVAENLLLGHLAASKGFLCGYKRRNAEIEALLALLELPLSRLRDDSLLNLSGGMQQKIIIARWLLLKPKVLMLDEPTRGVDIATRASIYKLLRKIADEGVAVLVVSSDFEELLGLCERVIVVSDGRSTADLPAASLVEETLTFLAAPRSSMAPVQTLLTSLAAAYDGMAFWGIFDQQRITFLATAAAAPPPWLRAGQVAEVDRLPIGALLQNGHNNVSSDQTYQILTMPLTNERGHENGFIALVVSASAAPLPAQIVQQRVVETLAAVPLAQRDDMGDRL
ncbi:sugar ABC transporter ATP-binding protein [Acidisoma cellulosilytica]|uniref:Sugar ABC transporter ATP-binding protein n=1 Tax=Acidisoma cellulosilyticum TaxID=2802395 RepID=A0A963Z3L5_9PROT|nr:sugar ABC transporter ATP-binding protein [Acidisoma cellulosilyticum]MCB8882250.1 sugar ABC transporter ATP-binding protein [Acidisoma cellulosilyticum]